MDSFFSGSSAQTRQVLWVRSWLNHFLDIAFPLAGQILTFCTPIMRGVCGFPFPLPAPTSSTSSTSSASS